MMANLRALCPGASAVPMLTSLVSTPRFETMLNGSTGSPRTTDESPRTTDETMEYINVFGREKV